jgi:hypothetical protein
MQELAEKYGVRCIPTMMVIDQQGKIAGVAHNVAALAPIAEKLLSTPQRRSDSPASFEAGYDTGSRR